MTEYRFPDGIVSISKEEMQEVLCNYDTIEIPGSVREVNLVNGGDAAKEIKTRNIILHEGTISVKNLGSHRYNINIPDTLIEMEGVQAPRVSCLPLSFRRAYHISGIEYLQAHPQADVRYPWDDMLKHFVLLGSELPYIIHRFEHVPEGCVIHVESNEMAETVLKYVDAEKIYVIPDADEWKDFPPGKMNLSIEEYDPESRLVPRQTELRKAKQAARAAEEEKRQEKLRQEGKERSIRKMVEPVIMPLLEGLLGPQETVVDWRYQDTLYKYSITVTEGNTPGETSIIVKATVTSNLSIEYYNQYKSKDFSALAVLATFSATDFPKSVPLLAGQITRVRDFLEKHRDVINRYHIIPGDDKFKPECSAPGIALPFLDTVIVGSINSETIGTDVTSISEFAGSLETLIRQAQEVFPKGFTIIPVEK